MVSSTEVIDTTQKKHGGMDGLGSTRQSARAAGETVKPLTKGGIEAFNVSCVDDTALLGAGQQMSEPSLCALHDTPLNGESLSLTVLDDLGDEQVRPSLQAGTSAPTGVNGRAEGLLEGTNIALPAIDRQQERAFERDVADLAS